MPKIKANGVNLHYITVGAGPDVVMLHGFLGNLAVWHLYMAPILRREHRAGRPLWPIPAGCASSIWGNSELRP